MSVRLEDARRVITAAEEKAAQMGQPMNIAVADEGGNLVAHVRMDGAWIGSVDISIKKAYTSRAFDIATKDLATHSQSGGQFFGIHASNNGGIMIFAGGIPLKRGASSCLRSQGTSSTPSARLPSPTTIPCRTARAFPARRTSGRSATRDDPCRAAARAAPTPGCTRAVSPTGARSAPATGSALRACARPAARSPWPARGRS